MRKIMLLFGVLALLGLSACSKDDKPEKPKDGKLWSIIKDNQGQNLINYSIISEDGQAVRGAKVLIGDSLDTPFQNNILTADDSGQFPIPTDWISPQSLTIDAPGFLRVTFLREAPIARQIIMHRSYPQSTHELKGITTGHPLKDKDGFIDFSLVMSTMSRQDLLNFDIGKFVSPQTDKITVVGQPVELPSNASIPRQKESYLLPVTLEKPIYRLYFPEAGIQKIYASRARFPFKKVVDGFRNNVPFYELINDFEYYGGTVKDLAVLEPFNSADLNVSEFNFTEKRNVTAPNFAADLVNVGVTVADMNGYMIPTDIKRLNSGQTLPLTIYQGHPVIVAQVLKRAAEFKVLNSSSSRLSAVILPWAETTKSPAEFMGLIADPVKSSDYGFTLEIPQSPATVAPLATYLLLSDIDEAQKTVQRTWEVYSKEWVSDVRLPNWPTPGAALKKRVEVSFVGSLNGENVDLGPKVIEAATHVTRSSADY
ncbi:MAG: hypothetical protein JNM39_03590 [Bdellovibrionaceae bacterium]|nr:hypothetical protein [Pseudobdellovibrionaceae bacterium]